MIRFTGKKVIRGKQEFINLLSNLKEDGYTWANGNDLIHNSIDTNYLMRHFPHLLVFDAKNKKVYYSSYADCEVEIDPNYR